MKPTDEPNGNSSRAPVAIVTIIAALVVWGTLLAIGAIIFGGNANKAIMISGSVGTFVGIWVLLLITRKRPLRS